MRETILQQHYTWSVQKAAPKSLNVREIRPFSKSTILQRLWSMQRLYSLCKIEHFGSKLKKAKKHEKNDSTTTLYLVCAKNRSKKHQMFKKRDQFENRPSCKKGYSPCKGYSLCKIGHFGSKIKNAKNLRKTIPQQHYSWSVQKTAPENTKCSRN